MLDSRRVWLRNRFAYRRHRIRLVYQEEKSLARDDQNSGSYSPSRDWWIPYCFWSLFLRLDSSEEGSLDGTHNGYSDPNLWRRHSLDLKQSIPC